MHSYRHLLSDAFQLVIHSEHHFYNDISIFIGDYSAIFALQLDSIYSTLIDG